MQYRAHIARVAERRIMSENNVFRLSGIFTGKYVFPSASNRLKICLSFYFLSKGNKKGVSSI